MDENLSIGDVILVSLQASLKVLLTVLVGVTLTRYGLMPQQLQKGVTTLVVYVFTPALLFVGVGSVVTWDRFIQWWPLLVFALTTVGISFVIGYIIAFIFRLGKAQRNTIISALAFRNTVTIPLSLIEELSNLTILLNGPADTAQLVASRGEAYVLFYTAIMNALRWTVGSKLMKPPEEEPEQPKEQDPLIRTTSLPHTHRAISVDYLFVEINAIDSIAMAVENPRPVHYLKKFFKALSPPVVATVLALIIGLIPPVKDLFFGDHAVLDPTITSALESLGDCAVPSTLLVLGSQLSNGPNHHRSQLLDPNDYLPWPAYVAVLVLSLLVSAVTGAVLVELLAWAAPTSLLHQDMMMRLVLMLEAAVPTAVNLLTLAALHESMQQTVTNILFYSYTLSTFSLTMACVFFVVVLTTFNI